MVRLACALLALCLPLTAWSATTTRRVVLEKADHGYRWKLTEAPTPAVGDHQVLVRVRGGRRRGCRRQEHVGAVGEKPRVRRDALRRRRKTFPFEQFAAALKYMASDAFIGKIVIEVAQ